eukprot:scaffold145397_cov27-Prasinocladus_malaysianus.AAC.2
MMHSDRYSLLVSLAKRIVVEASECVLLTPSIRRTNPRRTNGSPRIRSSTNPRSDSRLGRHGTPTACRKSDSRVYSLPQVRDLLQFLADHSTGPHGGCSYCRPAKFLALSWAGGRY